MFDNLRHDVSKRRKRLKSRLPLIAYLLVALAVAVDPQLRAVVIYRTSRWFRTRGCGVIARMMDLVNIHFCACEISSSADIGPGFEIGHVGGIVIGGGSRLGRNCIVFSGALIGNNFNHRGVKSLPDGRRQPIVGDNVMIGAGAKLLGPIVIGDNTIVGANAVVVTDIPPNTIAVGIPAKALTPRAGVRSEDGLG